MRAPSNNAPKDMWDKLEAQCNRRVHHRQKFQGELEGVEIFRSKVVGRELRRLIDDMVSIAYRMPGEIERIAEVKNGRKSIRFSFEPVGEIEKVTKIW